MKEEAINKVNLTREQIKNSALQDDSKELLYILLDTAAESANGSPDKLNAIGDTLLAFCLYEIRSAIRFPTQLNQAATDAIRIHTDNCPLRNSVTGMPKIAQWLFPFRWQITVLAVVTFLAPNALTVINGLVKLWISS
jgi:hypothetical protein